jgi:chromosome partitioning protein
MDGNDKRRGRRLFGSRRRQEDEEAVIAEPGPSATEGPPVSEPEAEAAVTGGSISPADAPAEAAASPEPVPQMPAAPLSGRIQPAEPASPPAPPDAPAPSPPAAVSVGSEVPATAPTTAVVPEPVAPPPTVSPPAPPAPPAAAPAPGTAPAAPAGISDGSGGASEEPAEEAPDEVDDDEDLTYDLPRILAIANQKGGVGKTTTSVNLGASLAELGYRVLVVDLDPQGNASTGLGINARNLTASIYDVIMNDAAIEDCVEPTSLKNLFLAPATIDLAGAEIELVPAFSRELKLRRALEAARDDYDYMIIDCPPSLGLLTVNGLAAADDVIVPIQCEYYALEGLSQLVRNVTLVQTNLNPKLDIRGIVLTMYDARTKLADQVEKEVRLHFGRRVYQTVVPRTVRLSEAPSFGQPIIVFDPTSRGAVAYRELAKEVSSGATRRTG